MGDIIHTLPALTDALHAVPDLKIDWVVEPAFVDIPAWHPAVHQMIPIALRKWRKNIFKSIFSGEIKSFYNRLRQKKYDLIIDAQGLLKSAVIAKLARGKTHGYNQYSIKEKIASYFYHYHYAIEKNQHAITRIRQLFANVLQYTLQDTPSDFLIDQNQLPSLDFARPEKYFVFVHGTTWKTKQYPEIYWQKLLKKVETTKMSVLLPWGNENEKKRAEKLANTSTNAIILPALSIAQMATVLNHATAVITVDTGLGHLSNALSTPTIALFGPTVAKKAGMTDDRAISLSADFPCAPCQSKICLYAKTHQTQIVPACYTTLHPDKIWETLQTLLGKPS